MVWVAFPWPDFIEAPPQSCQRLPGAGLHLTSAEYFHAASAFGDFFPRGAVEGYWLALLG